MNLCYGIHKFQQPSPLPSVRLNKESMASCFDQLQRQASVVQLPPLPPFIAHDLQPCNAALNSEEDFILLMTVFFALHFQTRLKAFKG